MKKNNLKTAIIVILTTLTMNLNAQTWGSSGTNATCTNGGSTRLVVKNDGTVWVGEGQLIYNRDFENVGTISLQPNISNSGLLLIEVTTSNGIFRNKLILNNN